MGGFVIAESQGGLDDDALAAMMEAVEARTAAAAAGGASDGASGGAAADVSRGTRLAAVSGVIWGDIARKTRDAPRFHAPLDRTSARVVDLDATR